MPRTSFMHRHIIVVADADLAAARQIAVEAAVAAGVHGSAEEAEVERNTFVPVPDQPGWHWCSSASYPALRGAVQSRMARLGRSVYFCWLDRDGTLQEAPSVGGPEAAKVRPDTGGRSTTARARAKVGKRFTIDDVIADVSELLGP